MHTRKLLILALATLAVSGVADSRSQSWESEAPRSVVLDDFEDYSVRGLPTGWKFIDKRQQAIAVTPSINTQQEYFIVLQEGGNKFVRAVTLGQAHRLILPNGDRFNWSLPEMPRLQWSWRAHRLPEGAREDVERLNDTGAAVYVTFSRDLLGRPKSIKYSYSSSLPVGTVVDYGRLKVIVASSGRDGKGQWRRVSRDVQADYRRVFGEAPPAKPLLVMIWSDSNNVKDGEAEVDFDDFRISGGR